MPKLNKISSQLHVCIASFIALTIILASTNADAKYASFVIDAKTGQVLHAINENTRNYPASLTKLMTLYLLFEALETKKLTMKSRLKVSRRAANRPASKLGLRPGQTIKVKDAMMAIIVKSANDVASVVAENIAGNEQRFALLMTNKARKLSMRRTTFRNASGLPHRGQLSTAKDMATLAHAIINHFPQYYIFFSQRYFKYENRTYKSHNKILKSFPGAEGMKTGYIRASGYNLVTTAKQNGKRIIGVVFGGKSSRSRNGHMKKLLTRAFKRPNSQKRIASAYRVTRKYKQHKAARALSSVITKKNRVWGIQVGAFYTKKPALSIAHKISKKYNNILNGGQIKVMPLHKSRNRILFRARIVGIKKRDAYRTCRLLRKNRQPCLELDLPTTLEIASR
jgi:D-alanyl-D-alanine carboxypeptidase